MAQRPCALTKYLQAHPDTIRNSAKRAMNLSERDRVSVEIPNGEFAFFL